MRDLRGAQPVDRQLEHRTVVVDEQVSATVVAEPEGAGQESGHLTPGDHALAAVAVVGRGIAAHGDPGGFDPVGSVLVEEAIVVDEEVAPTVVGVVEGP